MPPRRQNAVRHAVSVAIPLLLTGGGSVGAADPDGFRGCEDDATLGGGRGARRGDKRLPQGLPERFRSHGRIEVPSTDRQPDFAEIP
ncbi:MAG: hypothetical protein AAGM22_30190 [Acidobacteriota bacterium]